MCPPIHFSAAAAMTPVPPSQNEVRVDTSVRSQLPMSCELSHTQNSSQQPHSSAYGHRNRTHASPSVQRFTPSGVPPMPNIMSADALALATTMAAATSPSEISRMRHPVSLCPTHDTSAKSDSSPSYFSDKAAEHMEVQSTAAVRHM